MNGRLKAVPVFTVTSLNGAPIMLSQSDQMPTATYYLSSSDAERALDELSQSGMAESKLRLAVSDLESVLLMMKRTSSGNSRDSYRIVLQVCSVM